MDSIRTGILFLVPIRDRYFLLFGKVESDLVRVLPGVDVKGSYESIVIRGLAGWLSGCERC